MAGFPLLALADNILTKPKVSVIFAQQRWLVGSEALLEHLGSRTTERIPFTANSFEQQTNLAISRFDQWQPHSLGEECVRAQSRMDTTSPWTRHKTAEGPSDYKEEEMDKHTEANTEAGASLLHNRVSIASANGAQSSRKKFRHCRALATLPRGKEKSTSIASESDQD